MRAAVVGLGWAAGEFHLPALRAVEGVEIVGGADPSDERRAWWTQATGSPAFDSIGQLMESVQPELVVVGTPPSSHAELCDRRAGRWRARHLREAVRLHRRGGRSRARRRGRRRPARRRQSPVPREADLPRGQGADRQARTSAGSSSARSPSSWTCLRGTSRWPGGRRCRTGRCSRAACHLVDLAARPLRRAAGGGLRTALERPRRRRARRTPSTS